MGFSVSSSGGQYQWVASLAPPIHVCSSARSQVHCENLFRSSGQSEVKSGWLSVLGWQAFTASGTYLCTALLQGLMTFNHTSHALERYQSTLLVFAVPLFCVSVNTLGARALPRIESMMFIHHVLVFVAVLIQLVPLVPYSSVSFVLTDSESLNG